MVLLIAYPSVLSHALIYSAAKTQNTLHLITRKLFFPTYARAIHIAQHARAGATCKKVRSSAPISRNIIQSRCAASSVTYLTLFQQPRAVCIYSRTLCARLLASRAMLRCYRQVGSRLAGELFAKRGELCISYRSIREEKRIFRTYARSEL